MRKLFLPVLMILPLLTLAQKFDYKIRFEGIGDNREFFSGKSNSQTILGSRGSFELGYSAEGHHIGAGISELYEFGSHIAFHQPKLILYYNYEDQKKSFHFGSFPRHELVDFPLAMLSDTLLYYRPNIEGMRGEYRWKGGHQNIFVDWTGRQDAFTREAFTVAHSGKTGAKHFYFENFLVLNHLAGRFPRDPEEHVNDNLGYALQAGYRTKGSARWNGYLKSGILGSMFRERSVTDGFISATSLLTEAFLKHRNFAAKTVIQTGEGHIFLHGDPFYGLENYMRTDIIWYFINGKNVSGRFNLSFHLIEWNDLDQSQQISIVYTLPD